MAESAALLAELRRHVLAGRGCPPRVNASAGCPDCMSEVGFYCAVGQPLYEAFYEARRAEVLAARQLEQAS